MKLKLNNYGKLLNSKKLIDKCIKYTKENYRPYDPGQYLYNILVDSKEDKFSDKYLELVYTTLISWNMDSRGASLQEFDKFKQSIKNHKKEIKFLEKYKIERLNEYDKKIVIDKLESLFNNLSLTQTKAKLVTFSKTLHFLIPTLIPPIDRKYTLTFFYNNTQMNNKYQFKYFKEIFENYILLSQKYDLTKHIDHKWNRNIPKILDNIIIGYSK